MTRLETAGAGLVAALRQLEAAGAELVAAIQESAPAGEPERLLSLSQAAEALGVSRRTVYDLIGDARLPSMKIARRRLVSSSALAEYIAGVEAARP